MVLFKFGLMLLFILARGIFWLTYKVSWTILRPLVWLGGPQKAHERSLWILMWLDDHPWTWNLVRGIHLLAYGLPREWEAWFGIDWSKYDL